MHKCLKACALAKCSRLSTSFGIFQYRKCFVNGLKKKSIHVYVKCLKEKTERREMSKTCTVYDRPRVWLVMFDRISASMPFKQRCQPGSYHIYHIYVLCIQQNGCQWAFLPNLQCYKMKLQT